MIIVKLLGLGLGMEMEMSMKMSMKKGMEMKMETGREMEPTAHLITHTAHFPKLLISNSSLVLKKLRKSVRHYFCFRIPIGNRNGLCWSRVSTRHLDEVQYLDDSLDGHNFL